MIPVTYESRITLRDIFCNHRLLHKVETVYSYLNHCIYNYGFQNTLQDVRVEKGNKDVVLQIRQKKGRHKFDIKVFKESFAKHGTLERVAFELGWCNLTEWDSSQV